MDLELVKAMKTTLLKIDDRRIFGSVKSSTAQARNVTEATRNEVITPQVNDRSPKVFAHSIAKPKRILPPNNRKATLKLPSISSQLFRLQDF